MVTRYPSNAAREQRAKPKRPDYQRPVRRSFPANDNSKSLPPLTKAAMTALGATVGRGFGIGWNLGQSYIDAYGNPLSQYSTGNIWDDLNAAREFIFGRPRMQIDRRYWMTTTMCRSGGDTIRIPAIAMNPGDCSSGHYQTMNWWQVRAEADPAWTFFEAGIADAAIAAKSGTSFSIWNKAHFQSGDIWWYLHNAVYNAVPGSPVPSPVYTTQTLPQSAMPLVVPLELPFAWPIAVPLRMAPAARPQPAQSPQEEPANNPENKPDVIPGRKPVYRLPVALPPFIQVPDSVSDHIDVRPPDIAFELAPTQPGRAPSVRPAPKPDPATATKPPRLTRQKKTLSVAKIGGVIWTGINSATEAMDFVVVMHDSLRKDKQLSKKASKSQKLKYMLTNFEVWGYVDVAEGLQNFINMQASDVVAAIGSEQIKKVMQDANILTGLDRAIRQAGDRWNEGTKQVTGQNAPNLGDLLPQLDIDMVNGRVSISDGVLSKPVVWKW